MLFILLYHKYNKYFVSLSLAVLPHFQMIMVILLFTKDNLQRFENAVLKIPVVGVLINQPIEEYMNQTRETLHNSTANHIVPQVSRDL